MELFQQAFTIMVLGMVLVFAFLGLVILAMNVSAVLVHRFEREPENGKDRPGEDSQATGRRVAVIAAALFRTRHGR